MNSPLLTLAALGISVFLAGGFLGGQFSSHRQAKQEIKEIQQQQKEVLEQIQSAYLESLKNEQRALAQIDSVYLVLDALVVQESGVRTKLRDARDRINSGRQQINTSKEALAKASENSIITLEPENEFVNLHTNPMYMKNHLFRLLPVLGWLVIAAPVFGQKIDEGLYQREAQFQLSKDSTVKFYYFEVQDTQAFRRLARKVKPENFPLTVLKKPVLDPFFDLIQYYDSQLDRYVELDTHYQMLDTIHQRQIRELQQVNALQTERVNNYKNLSDTLLKTNTELSNQLTASLKVASECNKSKVKKQFWVGALGFGIGFTVAGLIAFLN